MKLDKIWTTKLSWQKVQYNYWMQVICPDEKKRLPGIAIKLWKPSSFQMWIEILKELDTFEKIDKLVYSIKKEFPQYKKSYISKWIKKHYLKNTWDGYAFENEFESYILNWLEEYKKETDRNFDVETMDYDPILDLQGIDLRIKINNDLILNFQIKKTVNLNCVIREDIFIATREGEEWKIVLKEGLVDMNTFLERP